MQSGIIAKISAIRAKIELIDPYKPSMRILIGFADVAKIKARKPAPIYAQKPFESGWKTAGWLFPHSPASFKAIIESNPASSEDIDISAEGNIAAILPIPPTL